MSPVKAAAFCGREAVMTADYYLYALGIRGRETFVDFRELGLLHGKFCVLYFQECSLLVIGLYLVPLEREIN